MADRNTIPSAAEMNDFNAACQRAGRHFAKRVREVEMDLIMGLLKAPAQQGVACGLFHGTPEGSGCLKVEQWAAAKRTMQAQQGGPDEAHQDRC